MNTINKKLTLTMSILSIILFLVSCGEDEADGCTEQAWFQDVDEDGLGNPNVSITSCDQPNGFVSNSDDTNDTPVSINPTEANTNIPIPTSGYIAPESYPGKQLVFNEEFDGDKLNEEIWTFQIGDGCPDLCGWGNRELQYYQDQNIALRDGNLIIEARNEQVASNEYTSTRINTKGKYSFQFGRVDVRAALLIGQGIWPAIWTLGENIDEVGWPQCGEIDIMEMVGGDGRENKVLGTAHWDNNGSNANFGGEFILEDGIFNDEFHVFSIEWDTRFIRWYVDNVQYHVIDITPTALSELRNPHHFLLNIAVGGTLPGDPDNTTTFPQYMIVDYIKVFQ